MVFSIATDIFTIILWTIVLFLNVKYSKDIKRLKIIIVLQYFGLLVALIANILNNLGI